MKKKKSLLKSKKRSPGSKSPRGIKKINDRRKKKTATGKVKDRKRSSGKKNQFGKRRLSEKDSWTWRHIPYPIKLLISYNVFIAIFYLFYVFAGNWVGANILFGYATEGSMILFLNIIFLIVVIAFVISLLRRNPFAYRIGIVWYSLGIIDSLFTLQTYSDYIFREMPSIILFISLSTFLINVFSIFYIHQKKNFLIGKNKDFEYSMIDKIFFIFVFGVWALVILFLFVQVIAFFFVAKTHTPDLLLKMDGMTFQRSMDLCNSESDSIRDLCHLLVVLKYDFSDVQRLKNVCMGVEKEFLRFSCKQILFAANRKRGGTNIVWGDLFFEDISGDSPPVMFPLKVKDADDGVMKEAWDSENATLCLKIIDDEKQDDCIYYVSLKTKSEAECISLFDEGKRNVCVALISKSMELDERGVGHYIDPFNNNIIKYS